MSIIKRIAKHRHVQRLRGISLSAVPKQFAEFPGPIPDRYEHSVSVSRLSNMLNESFSRWKTAIAVSGLLHDIGSPPFNHIAEEYMEAKFGYDHEKLSKVLIMQSSISGMLRECGIYNQVMQIFDKGQSISKIMFGKIDLDNIDNLHKFDTIVLKNEPIYSRHELAQRFELIKDDVYFRMDAEKWKRTRWRVYNYLANSHWNMAAWAMLKRAHDLSYEHLDENYFRMTDEQAIDFLSKHAPKIMGSLKKHEYYEEQFRIVVDEPPKLSKINERVRAVNEIAELEGFDKEDICVLISDDRRSKDVKRWFLCVFSSRHIKNEEGMQNALCI